MHTRFRFRGRTRVGIGETDFNVGLVYTYTRVYMCACVYTFGILLCGWILILIVQVHEVRVSGNLGQV